MTMKLTQQQRLAAVRYNAKMAGFLYRLEDLPAPWNRVDALTFAAMTAQFQLDHALPMDGKLGPATLAALRRAHEDTPRARPARTGPSNAVIIRGERVPLPRSVLDAGGIGTNYLDDDEPHLSNGPRVQALTVFVLHETAGNSATGCKDTLRKRGLGIHLILGKDGRLSCHADLASEIAWHANQCNAMSVGLEVVNPYRPELASEPHGPIIPAAWWTWVPKGQAREYVCPTDVQMAVAVALVPWLCDRLGIPVQFPTADLNAKRPQITGWRKPPLGWSAKPGPGIVAHRDFASHADGRYLLERLMEVNP